MPKGKPELTEFLVITGDNLKVEYMTAPELKAWVTGRNRNINTVTDEYRIVAGDEYGPETEISFHRIGPPEQKPTPGKKRGRKSKAEKAAAKNQTEGYAQVIKEQGRERSRVSIRDTDGKPISGSGEAVQS